jgi:mycothiol synthase
MLEDPQFQPERVLFIEHGEVIVATASAWRSTQWGGNTGVIHMVASSSSYRGHHLGYLISLAALHRFVNEGIHHALLRTDDNRLPAIATYFKLGFLPYLETDDHAVRWREVYQNLK